MKEEFGVGYDGDGIFRRGCRRVRLRWRLRRGVGLDQERWSADWVGSWDGWRVLPALQRLDCGYHLRRGLKAGRFLPLLDLWFGGT